MFVIMEAIDPVISEYLDKTCDAESPLLQRINRETHLRETMPHMLSGHYQGRVLSLLSKLKQPKKILEIGTFTGYATLCLAEGLSKDGILHTIDINEELFDRVNGYFQDSPYFHQIKYHIGPALDIIPTLPKDFDLVFIDADKANNLNYFEMCLEHTEPGAFILIDNVLWKGKVFKEATDKQTLQIVEFNEKIAQDDRVEKLILPIRDGLFVCRKK